VKEYDAYLFDWDGTVAQTLGAWLKIAKETFSGYGIQAGDKDIVRLVFGRARAGLLELGIPEEDFEGIFKGWTTAAQREMPQVPLYPGMPQVLAACKLRGKKLAVITATIRPVTQKVLDGHGLNDAFDVVVTGDEVRAHKPDPEGILFVLDHLGVPKHRAVMFGDSEKDILAAHNAGIDSVLFYPPEHKVFHTLAELQADKPTYTIHAWKELLDQLQ
jgi:HAD superfamily hydrolase (TIGR01509 family)